MNRLRLYLLVFSIWIGTGIDCLAQRYNIDSLENELRVGQADTNRVHVLNDLIAAYFIRGDKALALETSQKVIDLTETVIFPKGRSTAFFRRGIIFHRGERFEEALECYQTDLRLREEIGDFQGAIGTINNIGIIQSKVFGRQSEARDSYLKALNFALVLQDSAKLPHIYTNFGITFVLERRLDSAEFYYGKALNLHLLLGNLDGAANTYNNMAVAHKNQGELQKAFDYYHEALALYSQTNSVQGEGNSWLNLGVLHIRQKQYQEGIDALNNALTIFEENELPKSLANVYGSLSTVYRDLQDMGEAKTIGRKVMQLRREVGVNVDLLKSLNVQASIHLQLAEYDSALLYLDEGIALSTAMDNAFQLATFQYRKGEALQQRGQQQLAWDWYEQADAINQKLNNKELTAPIALGKARILAAQGQWRLSTIEGERAHALATELQEIKMLRDAAAVLAEAYAKRQRYAEAYRYQTQHLLMNDSILNEEAVKTVTRANLERRFETEKIKIEQDRMIEKQSLENEMQQQARVQNYILAGLGLFVVFSFIIFWVYRREKNYTQVLNLKSTDLERKNRQIQELTTFRNSLTQMIAHDMKNPLNVIISLAGHSRKVEDMKEVEQSGKMMLQLVNNMLDIQRFEETKMQLKEGHYSLQSLVLKARLQVELLLMAKSIEFTHEIPQACVVHCDEGLTIRILVNLYTNAIKYMPIGGKLGVVAAEENGRIRIAVSDTGKGIPAELQVHIFDKFWQSDPKKYGMTTSNGLGLTFCKLAVMAHGGDIRVESVEGEGATFHFDLAEGNLEEVRDGGALPELVKHASLSAEDREKVQRLSERLQGVPIYKSSKIEEILKELDAYDSPGLNNWKRKLREASYGFDNQAFEELIRV